MTAKDVREAAVEVLPPARASPCIFCLRPRPGSAEWSRFQGNGKLGAVSGLITRKPIRETVSPVTG